MLKPCCCKPLGTRGTLGTPPPHTARSPLGQKTQLTLAYDPLPPDQREANTLSKKTYYGHIQKKNQIFGHPVQPAKPRNNCQFLKLGGSPGGSPEVQGTTKSGAPPPKCSPPNAQCPPTTLHPPKTSRSSSSHSNPWASNIWWVLDFGLRAKRPITCGQGPRCTWFICQTSEKSVGNV